MDRGFRALRRRLDDANVPYEIIEHPYALAAQRIADVEHVPGHLFAKCVMAYIDGRPSLLALPAPHIVDFDRLCQELGARGARLASKADIAVLFPGCEVGAMPPFSIPGDIGVYVDRALLDNPEIVFEAGSHTRSVRMRTEDYVRLARPRVLSFGREPAATSGRPAFGNLRPAGA